mgnify:CR=1 FL=1
MNTSKSRQRRTYKLADKLERNRRLLAMHQAHPEMSLAELGRRFDGISRQRVKQILNQLKDNEE